MINTITIQGNLVNEVVKGSSNDGKSYAYGKVAVNQGKDKDGNERDAMFFDFTVFGYDADNLAELGKKGDSIVIVGRLEEQKSTNSEGKTFINKKIIANLAKVILKKSSNGVDPFQF